MQERKQWQPQLREKRRRGLALAAVMRKVAKEEGNE
uniref:Uncharacterized protein n=1 Tax=Arundo donax TaxID=35708 RepID=A0A0A9GFP8_ARUDO